ncbi:DUF4260 domain-containing protein [Flectobacillus major]|uniref:DUF4260 domain-containing protein n=1 Tax=Flectobacillus major TaxID=103 RepID=UPI00040FE92B|nr:DUF4260 domain-containing protein [Flectobacillus major]
MMKTLLKLEELAQFVAGIILFNYLPYAWWYFLVLILLPDIGMLGYLINTKTGAWIYNLFHHKAVALTILTIGYYQHNHILLLVGVILWSHAAMDRLMGYGLKYEDSFKHTSLS